MVQETSKLIFMFCMYGQNCIYKIFNGYKYNYIGLTEFFLMDSVNVQIYKIDIGKCKCKKVMKLRFSSDRS